MYICQAVGCEVRAVTAKKLSPGPDLERYQCQHWSCLSRVREEAGTWEDVQTIILIPYPKGSASLTG